MTPNELEQQLWELEFGLLPDEEAAALRDRLEADPELAAAMDRVQLRRTLVAHAARIEAPLMTLNVDAREAVPVPSPNAAPSNRKRLANWCMAIAASLLVGLLTWNLVPEQQRLGTVASSVASNTTIAEPVFLKIDAPAKWSTEATNLISFRAESAEGLPQAANLEVRLLDRDGKELGQKFVTTDQRGRYQLGLSQQDVTDVAQAHVSVKNAVGPTVNLDFGHSEPTYATHLVTDKPRYHPGDTVRFRSTTLTRFGLRADREHEVTYRITDPNGEELPNGKRTDTTQAGVGSGEVVLTDDALHGRYSLFAASPKGTLPEERCDFDVTIERQRAYDLDVHWNRERFAAGETAVGELLAKKLDGQPAASENIELRAFVDGLQAVVEPATATLDTEGKAAVRVTLPNQIASTVGDVGIVVAGRETEWLEIPLRADQVQVDLYPEGGDLVATVENRVYFSSHDPAGKPVALRGRLLESGRSIANIQTAHEGRGAFRFTPAAGLDYSISVDDPPGIKSTFALPPVATNAKIVFDAGVGVFAEKQPLTVELRAESSPPELVVAAFCRGVTVGQQSIASADFSAGRCIVTMPIAEDAAGVLRVTVFDYSKQPPEPIAERLVYRRPAKKLAVHWDDAAGDNATTTTLGLQIVDEAMRPRPAVLGIAVADDAVLRESKRPAPRIDAQFLLLGDIDHPEQLEDASFYISEQTDAAEALDLLLGTQGWRRFERIPASRLAQVERFKKEQLAYRNLESKDVPAEPDGLESRARSAFTTSDALADADHYFADVTEEAPRRVASVFVAPREQQLGRLPVPANQPMQSSVDRRRPSLWLIWLVGGALSAGVLVAAWVRWQPRRRVWLSAMFVFSLLGGFGFWWCARSETHSAVSAQRTDAAPSSAAAERGVELAVPFTATEAATPRRKEQESDLFFGQSSTAPPENQLPGLGGVSLVPSSPRSLVVEDAAQPAPSAAGKPITPKVSPTDPVDLKRRSTGRVVESAASAPLPAKIEKLLAPEAAPRGPVASPALAAPVAPADPLAKGKLDATKLLDQQDEKLVRRFARLRELSDKVQEKAVIETWYWNPRLITDANGRAVISFPSTAPNRTVRVLLDAHQDGRVLGAELAR